MANSVTLGMVAAGLPPSLSKTIITAIMQVTPVLPFFPLRPTPNQFHLMHLQDVSVPTPTWRMFNQNEPSPTRGTQRASDRWAGMLDFVIKVDRRLVAMPQMWEDPKTSQTRLHAIGAAFEMQRVALHGNHLTTPAEPDGIMTIMTAEIAAGRMPAAQLVDASDAALSFSMLDQLSYICYGANRDYMMNPFLHRKVLSLARDSATSGYLRIVGDREDFGTRFKEYDGKKLLIIERMDDHSSDLAFNEDDGGGNLDAASILLPNFSVGPEQGVFMFGPDPQVISAQPFKEIPGTPFDASYSSWAAGFEVAGPTGFARLNHILQA